MDTDVLVVGAGPTGLTLANELRLAGVSAVLVDKLPRRSDAVEGRRRAVPHAGGVRPARPAGTVAGHRRPPGRHRPTSPASRSRSPAAGTACPWRSIPQVVIEGFLEQHLAAHGIHVRRDHELTGLAQDEDGVTATFADGAVVRSPLPRRRRRRATARCGRCWGPSSPVGRARATMVAADVRLSGDDEGDVAHLERGRALGGGVPARHRSAGQAAAPAGRSAGRAGRCPGTSRSPRTRSATACAPCSARGCELLELRYARRITNAARQVAQYRHGRVFLAGDAAHVHLPLGAQGMNTGIQDALNLGWKLGAAVHGWAPEHLLDTYHAERHPVGGRRPAQRPGPEPADGLGGHPRPGLAGRPGAVRGPGAAAGGAVPSRRPVVRDGHPLPDAGRRGPAARRPARVPDLDLGSTRSHELLRSGRGVLLDPADAFAKVADALVRTGSTVWARAPTPSRCSSGPTATCAGPATRTTSNRRSATGSAPKADARRVSHTGQQVLDVAGLSGPGWRSPTEGQGDATGHRVRRRGGHAPGLVLRGGGQRRAGAVRGDGPRVVGDPAHLPGPVRGGVRGGGDVCAGLGQPGFRRLGRGPGQTPLRDRSVGTDPRLPARDLLRPEPVRSGPGPDRRCGAAVSPAATRLSSRRSTSG